MNANRASAIGQASLPQLSGGLLTAYRAIWAVLAMAALAVLCLAIFELSDNPLITTLRLVKGAVVVGISTTLLRRRQRDPVAALLALAFLSWTISSSVDFAAAGALAPMLLDRLRFLLFTLALLLFPDGRWSPGWTRQAAFATGAVFVIGFIETLQIVPTRLFLPLAIGCVLSAVFSLVARFRAAPSERLRQQLRWVALGLVCGITLILSARAGAALSGNLTVAWEAMFQLGVLIIALGFLVSLLRYRLYDAETAISRSAAYAALTFAMVATFAGSEAMIEWLGQQYLGAGVGNISAAMAAAVAAVMLNPLHSRISEWAEQRFQRDLVLLKRDLPELLADLALRSTSHELGRAALAPIAEAVHVSRAALVSGGTVIAVHGTTLEHGSASLLTDRMFPVRLAIGCKFCSKPAWLMLGPRPDGSRVGGDDLEALAAVGPAIRHALATADARETIRAEVDRNVHAIQSEMHELGLRLGLLEMESNHEQ